MSKSSFVIETKNYFELLEDENNSSLQEKEQKLDWSTLKNISGFDLKYKNYTECIEKKQEMENFALQHHDALVEKILHNDDLSQDNMLSKMEADYIKYAQRNHGMFDELFVDRVLNEYCLRQNYPANTFVKSVTYARSILQNIRPGQMFMSFHLEKWNILEVSYLTGTRICFETEETYRKSLFKSTFFEKILSGHIKPLTSSLQSLTIQ